MAKKFEFFGIVVSRQSFLVRFHVQYVKENLCVTVLLGGFPISPGRCLHGVEGRAVYTETGVGVGLVILVQITDVLLENLHPYFTVMVQYILQVVLLIW